MKGKAALLIVDVQSDFCPGGALPVPDGDLVVDVLNRYLQLFGRQGAPIFASRDWHPSNSSHFRENGGVWPAHCVQQSPGARFHPQLILPCDAVIVSKGLSTGDDGYSALQGLTGNGVPLVTMLRELAVERLYVGGLATDYCVKESVLEALREGFGVTVLADAVAAVEVNPGDTERAVAEMVAAGALFANLEKVEDRLTTETDPSAGSA